MKITTKLSVGIVQFNPVWHEPSTNFDQIEKLVTKEAQNLDLIVLPEMFNTGYSMDSNAIAEPKDGATLNWMKQISSRFEVGICGSIAYQTDTGIYNSFFLVEQGDIVGQYNKKHLFTYANEPDYYSAGTRQPIWSFRGWKIAPFVCYDIRFPAFCRHAALSDLTIFVASFPASRIAAWTHLLRARAIENQTFTIGVNRIGQDGYGTNYNGQSTIIQYDGDYLIKPFDAQALKIQVIDKTLLDNFRNKFPFLKDDTLLDLK